MPPLTVGSTPVLTLPPSAARIRRERRWATVVQPHDDGSERRYAIASGPTERLMLGLASLDPTQAGALLHLLWTAPHRRVLVPRWYDARALTARAEAGDSVLAVEETTGRAFVDGAQVLLWHDAAPAAWPTAPDTAAVALAAAGAVALAALTLAAPLARAWPAGAVVVPLVAARLVHPVALERLHPVAGLAEASTLIFDVEPDLVGLAGTGGEAVAPVPASLVLTLEQGRENALWYTINGPTNRLRATVFDAHGARIPAPAVAWSVDQATGCELVPTLAPGIAVARYTEARTYTITATAGTASDSVVVGVSPGP